MGVEGLTYSSTLAVQAVGKRVRLGDCGPFGAHIRKLEQFRDQHGPKRMAHKSVKCLISQRRGEGGREEEILGDSCTGSENWSQKDPRTMSLLRPLTHGAKSQGKGLIVG